MNKSFFKKFDNLIRYYFYLISIAPIFVVIYLIIRNYFINHYWIWYTNHFNFYILLLFFLSGLVYFIPKIKFKRNYFVVHASLMTSIFLINLVLELNIKKIKEKSYEENLLSKGFVIDKRDRREYIEFLKKKLNKENIYPYSSIRVPYWKGFKEYLDLDVKNKIYSFSHISNSLIVTCNESGTWQHYKSDKYGFHNPEDIITNKDSKYVLILGDSFAEGICVKDGDDVGNQLRKLKYNVLNLGKAAGGIIQANAIYREYKSYVKGKKPDVVILLFYGVNDILDTFNESRYPNISNYFYNPDFSNNLIKKQNKIDEMWKNIFEITYEKKFYYERKKKEKEKNKLLAERNTRSEQLFWRVAKLNSLRKMIFKYLDKKPTEEHYNIYKKAISKLNQEVIINSKLIVVYLPNGEELQNNDLRINKRAIEILNNLNIDSINLFNAFKKDNFPIYFDAYPYGHYNSKGYNSLARTIDKYLKKNLFQKN